VHYDSLLANLTHPDGTLGRGAGWERYIYRAVERFSERMDLWDRWEQIRFGDDEYEGENGDRGGELFLEDHRAEMLAGARVLWKPREDYEALMRMRAVEGHGAFQAEKQNEPLDPEHCLFAESSFRYWDDPRNPRYKDEDAVLRGLGYRARIYGACDPSLGRHPGRGDYSAIITIVKNRHTDRIYVIGADTARRSPDETIERIVQLSRIYEYETMVVETNQFQELLADQLEQALQKRGRYIYLERVEHRSHKQTRIQSLQPLISHGKLWFSRRHQTLLEQLRQYPLGAHDDGPDALEMAVHEALDLSHDAGAYQILM